MVLHESGREYATLTLDEMIGMWSKRIQNCEDMLNSKYTVSDYDIGIWTGKLYEAQDAMDYMLWVRNGHTQIQHENWVPPQEE